MRYAAKADANQPEIVEALRAVGATVQHLHTVGRGCLDLLVGFRGQNFVIEVKVPGGKLTPAEDEWIKRWQGSCSVVENRKEALAAIGVDILTQDVS